MLEENKDTRFLSKPIVMLIVSFSLFGVMPIYWAQLSHVDTKVILFYRTLMTAVFLLPFICYHYDLRQLGGMIKRMWPYLLLSSASIALNWLTYIYAVNHQHVFEGSLGYFLSPLINVALGYFLLKEEVSRRQRLALLFVVFALTFLVVSKGVVPKYALVIATSFSLYGIIGKLMKIPVFPRVLIDSLMITLFLMLPDSSMDSYTSQFFENDSSTKIFLIFSGVFTIAPLCLYAEAVTHVKFATAGMLSFLLPTIVFLISIFYFHETFDSEKFLTIMVIWPSIGLYMSDLIRANQPAEALRTDK
jgi:chloramphenicol-sensitive protein RarD